MKQFHFGVATLSLHLPPSQWRNERTEHLTLSSLEKMKKKETSFSKPFMKRKDHVNQTYHLRIRNHTKLRILRDEGDEFIRLTTRLKIYPA